MSWVAVASVGGALVSGYMGSKAGKKGADAQSDASRFATEEQKRQFDLTRQDLQPWMIAGRNALDAQDRFLAGDWSGFENSPDYKFTLDQGMKGLDRSAAARGALFSGGADADRIALGQGLAAQQAGTYWNRLSGLSGTGQTTANQLGQYGANYANQAGDNAMNAANARASSYANSANAWGNALNQGLGWLSYSQGRKG